MAETARERSRRLYGRPRVPRSHRRVMVALLAAPGLSGLALARLAQVGSAHPALSRMEALGWVNRARRGGHADHLWFAYTLTAKGRASVTLLLGLPAETAAADG